MKINFSQDVYIEEVTGKNGVKSNDPYPFKVYRYGLCEETTTLSRAIEFLRERGYAETDDFDIAVLSENEVQLY